MTARRRLTRFEKIAATIALFTLATALMVGELAVSRGYLYWIGAR